MSLLWSSKRLTVVSPCEPVLVVALLGFDPGETLALEMMLEGCDALASRWRTGLVAGADLWVVNGRTASLNAEGELEVDGLRFRTSDAPRPVAFANPTPMALDARFHFDADSADSLTAMLAALGPWLLPRVVQQALVGHLIANAARFTRSTVIHVQDKDRLLAVMNFSGDTGIATDATPAAIRRADWLLRPATAGFVPSIFHAAPTEEVLWRFATRADAFDLLPSRYLRLPIYLRKHPEFAPAEMSPRHITLLSELAAGDRTFRELRDRLDCSNDALRRDLGALYLVGVITCDPMRSLAAAQRRRSMNLLTDSAELSTNGSSILGGSVPAPLENAFLHEQHVAGHHGVGELR
jgi:hypothetical protein